MTYTIRKGVAPPPGRGYAYKYPFADMEVGDSFTIEEDAVGSVRRAAYTYTTRNRGIYRVRKGEDGLWACWRLA